MKLAIAKLGIIGLVILLVGACDNTGTSGSRELRQIGISSGDDSVAKDAGEQKPPYQVGEATFDLAGEGDLIVNVNTATREELETIPGIGPELAKRIIVGRPYRTVDDLIRVKGIGEYTLGSIRPYVKVNGKTERR